MPFPPTPSNTPSNTPTPSITASQTPTNTPTGTVCPGLTPTNTPTISLTPSITASPSNTPSMTASNTATPTQTQTPTSTVGTSPTPTKTLTATPTKTPTQTPTQTNPECTCFSSATVNVTVAGNITFNDCNGNPTIENFNPGNGQTYGDGTFCIRKDTNAGTAEYTIVRYNGCCNPPPPTPTPTPTPHTGTWTVSNYDCGLGTVNDVGINSNFMGSLPLGPSTFPLTSTLGGSRQYPNGVVNGSNTIQINHSTNLQGNGNCLAVYIFVNQTLTPNYTYYTSSSSPVTIISGVMLQTTDDVLVLVECYVGSCP